MYVYYLNNCQYTFFELCLKIKGRFAQQWPKSWLSFFSYKKLPIFARPYTIYIIPHKFLNTQEITGVVVGKYLNFLPQGFFSTFLVIHFGLHSLQAILFKRNVFFTGLIASRGKDVFFRISHNYCFGKTLLYFGIKSFYFIKPIIRDPDELNWCLITCRSNNLVRLSLKGTVQRDFGPTFFYIIRTSQGLKYFPI